MENNELLILSGAEVRQILEGQEDKILCLIKDSYIAHEKGLSSLPHSTFLKFPDNEKNRIISLPAFLGDNFNIAGIKWISSFPANILNGHERASAVLILNSTQTGHPISIMESSIISAKRTAASAALAAQVLSLNKEIDCIGMIGCGPINFEIAQFLHFLFPHIQRLMLFDLDSQRAEGFANKCHPFYSEISIEKSNLSILSQAPLISFATVANIPHIFDMSLFRRDAVILHISLRDLHPDIILDSDNITDDIDHVCRAQTSLHLSEQVYGNRSFIRCSIGQILLQLQPPRMNANKLCIFSPFGLGILDLALGQFVSNQAVSLGLGIKIPNFIPSNG